MFLYAQLNSNNICVGISQLSKQEERPGLIPIQSLSLDYMWKKYDEALGWSDEKFEPETTAPISEFEQLKAENTDLKNQLAATNADMQGLMDYLAETGVI